MYSPLLLVDNDIMEKECVLRLPSSSFYLASFYPAIC